MLIYDETVDFRYNDGEHKYTVAKKVDETFGPHVPVTGTTTIISVIAKPALMLWPMREAITHLKGLDKKPTEKDFIDAASAHRQKADAGTKAGKIGHALVEALLLGKKVKMPTDEKTREQAESVQSAFEKWQADFEPTTIDTEKPFYSLTHNFAGTYDYLCEIDGKLTMVDFKTTNTSRYNPDGIYAENFAQLGGYLIGAEEMDGYEVDASMVVNLPKDGADYKVKALADMRLTKTDAKLYFLNCLALYELDKQFNWKVRG